MALGPQNALVVGDIVEPFYIGGKVFPGNSRTIDKQTWFFWIDEEPDALFVHSTKFIYIDATHTDPTVGDGIIIEAQGWWPQINGTDFYSYPPPNSHPDLVYGTIPVVENN